jgi:hypothetical protein
MDRGQIFSQLATCSPNKSVRQAWEDMHAENSDMIGQAFKVRLGLLVDGSQDHDIKIKGFPDVLVLEGLVTYKGRG